MKKLKPKRKAVRISDEIHRLLVKQSLAESREVAVVADRILHDALTLLQDDAA